MAEKSPLRLAGVEGVVPAVERRGNSLERPKSVKTI